MKKIEKMKMETADGVEQNIEKIKALFPNCVTETIGDDGVLRSAINFDTLRQMLSDELIEGNEAYDFTWVGKRASMIEAHRPIRKTLRPCKEESVDWDTTQNLYIEGDNLEVLKLLQESYLHKVKMIYIDPPYNTGNDFIYRDKFAMNNEDYEEQLGLFDDETGKRLFKNTDSNGRFHSDWCSMIYPRLLLARNLLSEDGVIFISIDDHEQGNLKKICDEVLGAGNFVATFPWRKRTAKSDVPFGVSQDYEWVVCYAKSLKFVASVEGKERKYYESPDFPGRPWRVHDLTKQTTASERPNSFFTIVNPTTGEQFPANPNRTWAITDETFKEYYNADRIVFPGQYDFLRIQKPVLRYWKEDDLAKAGANFGRVAVSTKLSEDIGMSQDGTKETTSLFKEKIFSFPKPISLIEFFIGTSVKENDIVLDFFSGSATAAHAVMQLNAEDGGNRKFIMVQLPEPCDEKSNAYKAGYKNICEIGKERIRRAGKLIKESKAGNVKREEEAPRKASLFEQSDSMSAVHDSRSAFNALDVGFRVFKLDDSNMTDVYYSADLYKQGKLSHLETNIKDDRNNLDLLFGCLLDWGLPLSMPYRSEQLDGCTVHTYNDGDLIACFDANISTFVIETIARRRPLRAIFRDSGFADSPAMLNISEIFKLLSRNTEVKVL